jgi:hypothetical protein
MNPEKYKKFKDIANEYKIDIKYENLKNIIYYDDDSNIEWNLPNNISSSSVKASFNDMDFIIGMDENEEMHVIKNGGSDKFEYININIIIKMFIKSLRAGIMRFAAKNRFNIFSEAIEKDLEAAILEVVNKYDLNRNEISVREKWWEKTSRQNMNGK